MYDCELLKVEEHFLLQNIGLIVTPDFSVPEIEKWNDFKTEARVVYPEGVESIQKAYARIWHFNIRDPEVSINKRWRVVLSFPDSDKQQIPIGSLIFVSEDVYSSIRGKHAYHARHNPQ